MENETTIIDKANQFLCSIILPTLFFHIEAKYSERKGNNNSMILLLDISTSCNSIALLHCIMNLIAKIIEFGMSSHQISLCHTRKE